jgi:RimJ/RimL family protein N-acetyltransferase
MKSKKLLIRPSSFNDCNIFYTWENQEFIKEFFSISEDHNYEKIVREFVLYEHDPSKFQFTIVLSESLKPIGRIYLSRYDNHLNAIDLTRIYIGEEEYLGKGLGKESMIIILKFLFCELKIHRLTLDTFGGNQRARNLYTKLGFEKEGILRDSTRKNNVYYDLHLMSMLSNEYFENPLVCDKCREESQ